MPHYKIPLAKNIGITVVEKTKAFVYGAGRIILAISIVLWFLGTHGPGEFNQAETIVSEQSTEISDEELEGEIASFKLEKSYLGILGKSIEPVIEPLGYDWKIGIAVLSSFAAREVFVGTLATIYSVGDAENENTIRDKMAAERHPDGTPVFNFASGISLLLFYAFAMQCGATFAIVKKETNSWKWPLVQLIFMGALAYVAALLSFQFLK